MHVLGVAQLTAYLQDLLQTDPVIGDVWVRGEVTNLSRSAAGHVYFTLSGDGTQLSCVLFRGAQRGLLALPRNGESVLAHGRVSIYEGRGQYQLVVDNVAPEGVGVLQLQFEEMRRRLEAEGLFALGRKRPLPELPAAIGVVTSATGAVWHDIQSVIARRFPLTHVILAPGAVQGPDAPGELIAALQALELDGRAEVIIIARGGGSAEDLACFNDERLARAIFACSIPVISAVGHETDVTIADLVADLRAPTPSAAAELCVPNRDDLRQAIGSTVEQARSDALGVITGSREDCFLIQSRIARRSPLSVVERFRQDVDQFASRARDGAAARVAHLRDATQALSASAAHLDPHDVLRRGYAIVTTSELPPSRIGSARTAATLTTLNVTFLDGTVSTRVNRDQS